MPIPSVPSQLATILAAKTYNAAWFSGNTIEAQIQSAINQAALDSAERVYVPSNMLPYNANLVTFNNNIKMIREGNLVEDQYDVQAYGAAGNSTTDDATAINKAIDAAETVPGGGTVYVPRPTANLKYAIGSSIVVKDRVRLVGTNSRVAQIIALSTFPVNTPMISLPSSTSTFGSRIEFLEIDCNNIAGSIGISGLGAAHPFGPQEQCGVFNCMIRNFRDAGIDLAKIGSWVTIQEVEMFGSPSGANAGIRLNGSVSGVLRVLGCSISGDSVSFPITNCVDVLNGVINVETLHVEFATNGVNFAAASSGGRVHGFIYESTVTNGIVIAATSGGNFIFEFVYSATGSGNAIVDNAATRTIPGSAIITLYTSAFVTGNSADGRMVICVPGSLGVETNMNGWWNITNAVGGPPRTFPANDATPSVGYANSFQTANTGATTITQFDDGRNGQEIAVRANDANTTVANNVNISLQGAVNFVMGNGAVLTLVKMGAVWQEVSRRTP